MAAIVCRLILSLMGIHGKQGTQPQELEGRMARLGINESDLVETFIRSGGHGGQNVNKTSTCVVLLHRPSGVQVKCQATRHQGMNRLLARKLLLNKLEETRAKQIAAKRSAMERVRRRSRRPSGAAKERMLSDKSFRAQKKASRQKPLPD